MFPPPQKKKGDKKTPSGDDHEDHDELRADGGAADAGLAAAIRVGHAAPAAPAVVVVHALRALSRGLWVLLWSDACRKLGGRGRKVRLVMFGDLKHLGATCVKGLCKRQTWTHLFF